VKGIITDLSSRSPTSLKVVLKQLQKGRSLSLKNALEMEYTISQQFMRGKDFYEGVRAAIIDRDKTPKWNPTSLYDINEAALNKFFTVDHDDKLVLDNVLFQKSNL